MYQLIYASLSHTHYWHKVGMLYLFTMVAPARTLFFNLFCTITRASVSVQSANISRIPTCTAVNMHSGKMDVPTSGSGNI